MTAYRGSYRIEVSSFDDFFDLVTEFHRKTLRGALAMAERHLAEGREVHVYHELHADVPEECHLDLAALFAADAQ